MAGVKQYSCSDQVENVLAEKIASCLIFISPIQTFYHSQAVLVPSCFSITSSQETQNLIDKLKIYEEKNNLNKEFVFSDWSFTLSATIKCNTTLWDKSFEFKKLVEKIYAETQEAEQSQALKIQQEVHILTANKAVLFSAPATTPAVTTVPVILVAQATPAVPANTITSGSQ